MKTKWEEYKEKNGVTALDALNPKTKKADQDLSSNRLSICFSCPELIKFTTQCKKCGCFMKAKTSLADAKCPIGKW